MPIISTAEINNPDAERSRETAGIKPSARIKQKHAAHPERRGAFPAYFIPFTASSILRFV